MDSANASTTHSTDNVDQAPIRDGRHRRLQRARAHFISLTALALVASVFVVVAPRAGAPVHAAPGVHAGGDWVDLATGMNHTCARSANGEVRCWGSNQYGQLRRGDTTDIGDNAGEMGDNLTPVTLGGSVTELAAGFDHTCALRSSHVTCWGRNDQGQLGLGNTNDFGDNAGELGPIVPAVLLGTGRTATALAAGGKHTCALLDDGTVKCWGMNGSGQLGQGDKNHRGDGPGELGDALPPIDLGTGRTAVGITAAFAHTCALLDDGSVKCWGANFGGQLGQGDTFDRGGFAGQMGDFLPEVDLGTGRTAVSISAGSGHTCALLDDASVKCWGASSNGQLGYGDTVWRSDGPGEMGDNLPTVDVGTGRTAVTIEVGGAHSCARLDDQSFKCWGYNGNGQLLTEDVFDRGDAAGEMGDNLAALTFGPDRFVTAASAGLGHVCVVLDDNSVRCWGNNFDGVLGIGNAMNYGDNVGENGQNLPPTDLGNAFFIDPGGVDSFLPARLVETRAGEPTVDGLQQDIGRRSAGQVTEVQVTGRSGIDSEVEAAIVNLGIVNPEQDGFAVGYPCDEPQPASSTINYRAGETIANAATIKLSATGTICVYTQRATDLIFDVTSVIPFGSTVDAISPARFFESRAGFSTTDGAQQGQGRRLGGQTTQVVIGGRNGVPADAEAATVNIAAIAPDDNGYIAAWACGQPQPTASMINYSAGTTIAGGATISLGDGGAICVYTHRAMDLVVDVTAYTSPGAIINPMQPARLVETRIAGQTTVDGFQQGIGKRAAGQVTEVQVIDRIGVSPVATAGIFNVAVVDPDANGYAAIYPCDEELPGSSAINFREGQTIANNATIRLSATGTICVYTHRTTHLIVDLTATIR
ncbi:MAG: hypothetical protein AAGA42_20060 [Actinomycetota bacterium]